MSATLQTGFVLRAKRTAEHMGKIVPSVDS
jgi:hypothetical protein